MVTPLSVPDAIRAPGAERHCEGGGDREAGTTAGPDLAADGAVLAGCAVASGFVFEGFGMAPDGREAGQ